MRNQAGKMTELEEQQLQKEIKLKYRILYHFEIIKIYYLYYIYYIICLNEFYCL